MEKVDPPRSHENIDQRPQSAIAQNNPGQS